MQLAASIPVLRPFRRNVSQFEEPEKCVCLLSVSMLFSLSIIHLVLQRIPLFILDARKLKAKYVTRFQKLVQYL